MNRAIKTPMKNNPGAGTRIDQLIDVVDELIQVLVEENEWLAQGLPASRSEQISRKVELSDILKHWVDDVTSDKVNLRAGDTKLRAELAKRMEVLKFEIDENIVRLRGAIEASRRRIEAVMAAIREQAGNSSPYTCVGRAGSQMTTLGTNIRA
jgi:hypothetical protein